MGNPKGFFAFLRQKGFPGRQPPVLDDTLNSGGPGARGQGLWISRSLLMACLPALLLVAGCTTPPPPIRTGTQYADPSAYRMRLETVTRETKVYDHLDTQLLAEGTLVTPAFREA